MNRTVASVASMMALIGGVALIILGIASAFGFFFIIFYPWFALEALFFGIVMFCLGVVSAGGARFISRFPIAMVLLIVGIAASLMGTWFVSWLIMGGAILGMLSRL